MALNAQGFLLDMQNPTGRQPRNPEPQDVFSRRSRFPNAPLLCADFGEVESRVMAHYLTATKVVVVNPPEPRRRSWRDRLFSRPWQPLRATEPGPQHPLWGLVQGDDGYRVGDTLYVSPEGYETLSVAAKLPRIAS
jgi:hypothetical protein